MNASALAQDESSEVAGLYTAMRWSFAVDVFGPVGSGNWGYRMTYYLFSNDGRVFRGANLAQGTEDNEIASFDFDAARRRDPKNSGAYTMRGNEVIHRCDIAEALAEPRYLDGGRCQVRCRHTAPLGTA